MCYISVYIYDRCFDPLSVVIRIINRWGKKIKNKNKIKKGNYRYDHDLSIATLVSYVDFVRAKLFTLGVVHMMSDTKRGGGGGG